MSGESFVIRDVDRFAKEVIPTAYKHNNWSSFVRQLNFYGFRKVKTEVLSSVCEFKHNFFIRDKPQLLAQIKKANSDGMLYLECFIS